MQSETGLSNGMGNNGKGQCGGSSSRVNGRFHGRVGGHDRACEHPDCGEPGEFRAPRDREGGAALGHDRWRWFCLEHVRAFNAGYNYFDGMNADEIERAQRVYGGWERETRAFAANGDPEPAWARFTDPADILGARFVRGAATERLVGRNGQALTAEDQKALKVLGLDLKSSLTDVRRAYAERVRRYHPDKNGGDRRHERALQAVISAYTHLRKAPAFS